YGRHRCKTSCLRGLLSFRRTQDNFLTLFLGLGTFVSFVSAAGSCFMAGCFLILYRSRRRSFSMLTLPYSCNSFSKSRSTSTIRVISVLGVVSAFIPLEGKEKSEGVNTAVCAYCMSMLFTPGRLPTQPAIAT